MQSAVLRFFSDVQVEYTFTNRTPQMRLSMKAFTWLQDQVSKLANIRLSEEEHVYLKTNCKFLSEEYLDFLRKFSLRPEEQVKLSFENVDEEYGDLGIAIQGTWLDTILYEIPLLALTSEAYFKLVETDWSHEGQEEQAYQKGVTLFDAGCMVSEFGSRRRRDLKTHDLIIAGLVRASAKSHGPGKLTGTSNVFMAKKHGIPPVGTVAHEWYMGIASITDNYENANELGLDYWLQCFGEGVLGIALTDTFGTPAFFKAFKKNIPASVGDSSRTYAQVFTGIRQDSGDPKDYVKMAADFYTSQGINGKSLVFSDSLDTELCIEYKTLAEKHGFKPAFGVGTYFTNDYKTLSTSQKSKPLNIVIKISKAAGRPSIKISDNAGKNTGDQSTVEEVKQRLGYSEKGWLGGDESRRW